MARLAQTFESVTSERLPEVLKEFFEVPMIAGVTDTLMWAGTVTATWEHPARRKETESSADAAVRIYLFNQTEVDGSSTHGLQLTGIKTYGHFRFEVDNSKESPIGTEALTVHFSPEAKILVLVRRISPTAYQSVQFIKSKEGKMIHILAHKVTDLPGNAKYIEKAGLIVAR